MPVADDAALAAADVVLLRHGETVFNTQNRLSGDPSQIVPLSPRGREQAAALRPRLEPIPWAGTYVTRFPRTVETMSLILPGYRPPPVVLPDLDDIDVGEFEARPRDEYRNWRRSHGVDEAPRGGESRLAVVGRYARGVGWLAEHAVKPSLVVAHDQVLRYLENALLGEDPVFGPVGPIPNATPYAYAREVLADASERLAAYRASGGAPA